MTPVMLFFLASLLLAPPGPLDVLFAGDLAGKLVHTSCGKETHDPPDLAALVGTLRKRSGEARMPGPPAIRLLGGDVISPGLFAREALLRGGRPAAAELAMALSRAGFDAVALGPSDLRAEEEALTRYLEETVRAGVPVLASNLSCDGRLHAFCRQLTPALVVERSGERVGILAALQPRALAAIDPDRRAGITIAPVVAGIRQHVARLRAQGVRRIIVLLQIDTRDVGGDEALAAAEKLGGDHARAPDLVLVSRMSGPGGERALRLVDRDDAPIVAGATRFSGGFTQIELQPPSHPGARAIALAVPSDPAAADSPTRDWLARLERAFCANYGVPVAKLARPLDREAFTRYTLEVMRREAGAELAILGRSFVGTSPFPIRGAITSLELENAIPYRVTIGTVAVSGSDLATLLGKANPQLAQLGFDGETEQVNGRDLDAARSYRVATIEPVALGADGIFRPGDLTFEPLPDAPDLGELVETFMSERAGRIDGDATVSLDTDFGPPLAARTLLVGASDLTASFQSTTISNHPAYGDAQLARNEQRSLQLDYTGRLGLGDDVQRLDAKLNLRYGLSNAHGASSGDENNDLISLSALYDVLALRKRLRGWPSAAIPDPYARLLVESEFSQPDPAPDQPRAFHHLEVTGTVGALFQVASKFKARVGGGVRRELLASADAPTDLERGLARVRGLVEVGATLDPVAIVTVRQQTLRLEGSLDYSYSDPTRLDEHRLVCKAVLSVPVLPLLYLTAGVDAFALDRGAAGWASAFDTTFGVKVHLDAAHQRL